MRPAFQPRVQANEGVYSNNNRNINVSFPQSHSTTQQHQKYLRKPEFGNFQPHQEDLCNPRKYQNISSLLNPRRFNTKGSKNSLRASLKYPKVQFKKKKKTEANYCNNLLEIKPLDKISLKTKIEYNNVQEKTGKTKQISNEGEIPKDQEARRLAALLELEIKEDIYKINKEKIRSQHEQMKRNNGVSTIKSIEEIDHYENEIGPASVLKVELEEKEDAMYEIVTLKTSEGNLVTWKNPVLLRPLKKETENVNLPNIEEKIVFRKSVVGSLKGPAKCGDRTPLPINLQETPQASVGTPGLVFQSFSPQVVPNSCDVVIKNISRDTKSEEIEKLAKQIGTVSSYFHDQLSGKAKIKFYTPEEAMKFYVRFHRKLIDLSIISVALV